MNRKRTIVLSLIILLSGALITTVIFLTEPEAERVGAARETAMLVDVITVKRGDYQPEVIVTGSVIPAQDIILSPRISGEIIYLSHSYTPGGFIRKGETLLQIDPSDYRINLQLRKSELRQREADLRIEMGRQDVAKRDFQLLDESLSQEDEALVLREPQLNAARSMVEAARAAVDQAELDLDRTKIRAPFNAQILSRNVNVGSQVTPGDNLGRLIGLDTYWILATVPLAKVQWLKFPEEENESGSMVKVRNTTAWAGKEYREGHLFKLIGALEEQTRLARVLIEMPDPLGLKKENSELPDLMIGAFVETRIKARVIEDIVRLNRDFIRKNNSVWLMSKDKLKIKELNIIFQDSEYAYIDHGISENDSVVTSSLATVVDGAPLRIRGSEADKEHTGTVSSARK